MGALAAAMSKRRKRILVAGAGVVLIILLRSLACSPRSDLRVFHTPFQLDGDLRVRLESESSDKLLITRGDDALRVQIWGQDTVYRYDPMTDTLTEVPRSVWDNAPGQITDFNTDLSPPRDVLMEIRKGTLYAGELGVHHHAVATTGRTALSSLVPNPKGDP